jgi:CheY-like chemotaxis protein
MEKNKIMIIDNNPDQLYTLKAIFEETQDIEVIPVSSVEESISLIEKGLYPNLIISETIMPGADGFGLYHFLKNRELLHNIPIVYLTAWDINWEDYKEISNNTLIFEKPVNSEDLFKVINRTIMRRE